MSRLTDKIIIVTGGSGLLGKEIIRKLNDEGAICVNFEINVADKNDFTLLNVDVTNESSVKEGVEKVINRFGKINGLVNNAYPRTTDWGLKFEHIPFESWKKNVDWQLNSCFLLSQTVSKYMVKQGFGSIVNMASIYGLVGPNLGVYENTELTMPAAYSAIKGGLINFTRYLSSYLGESKIRVNAISPGGIFDNQSDSFVKNYERIVPMKRMGMTDDISPAVAFLLSDDAKYITGQNIIIDGGWTSI